jgi:hypothetical protein
VLLSKVLEGIQLELNSVKMHRLQRICILGAAAESGYIGVV